MDLGPHIPIRHLIDFMLRQFPLTEEEHDHLVKCRLCQQEMTEATGREMRLPPAGGAQEHVLTSRLVAHMLHQFPLSQGESDHLARCRQCQDVMVKATKKEWNSSRGAEDERKG